MPILFNKVERTNPQDIQAPKRWFPVLRTITRISEKQVAKEIADETTLNPKEAEMAVSQLKKVLIKNLLASNSVQLGDWGTFHLTCNGVGADTKQGVTAASISKLNIRFVPGKELSNDLAGATFVPAENL